MKKWMIITTASCLALNGSLAAHSYPHYQVELSPVATYIAQKTGDLVTIVVDENVSTEDSGDSELTRESSIFTELKKFFFPPFDAQEGFTRAIGSGATPGLDLASKSEFKGRAKNTAVHKFETRIEVRLIEQVRPGEFVIRGKRCVIINGRNKTIYVSGVIRQRDIGADNTIKSSLVADANVEIRSDVPGKDLKPGIFTRMFNTIF